MKLVLMYKTKIDFYSIIMNIFCPKCYVINLFNIWFSVLVFIESLHSIYELFLLITPFHSLSSIIIIKGYNRIGPHSKDVLSIIFGSLLGKGEIDIRTDGARIIFFQEAMHVKYLLWLHNQLQIAGYCDTKIPKIGTHLGKKGKLRKTIRFTTFTFTSFNWIYDIWYSGKKKVVPKSIGNYLTPLALAIWVMDSGVKSSQGLCFVNIFTYSDCALLVKVLHNNFKLKASIQSTGISSEYRIYIPKESMVNLNNKISSFIIPEMKYKLLP